MLAKLEKFARWETALAGTVVFEFIVFTLINPNFANPARVLRSMPDFIYLGIAALPLAIIMLSGGIDISLVRWRRYRQSQPAWYSSELEVWSWE